MQVLNEAQKYNKAIVALVVPLILLVLKYYGITPDNEVVNAIEILLSAALVYRIPNKK
jgi:hypothetical protein